MLRFGIGLRVPRFEADGRAVRFVVARFAVPRFAPARFAVLRFAAVRFAALDERRGARALERSTSFEKRLFLREPSNRKARPLSSKAWNQSSHAISWSVSSPEKPG